MKPSLPVLDKGDKGAVGVGDPTPLRQEDKEDTRILCLGSPCLVPRRRFQPHLEHA